MELNLINGEKIAGFENNGKYKYIYVNNKNEKNNDNREISFDTE
jgi:predicted transcriptional regulator